LNDVMAEWSDFYTLIGSTAATLIGLIFVVISLGADHAKAGDEHRLRVGVTPTLIHFASLLFSALAMMAPLSNMARALAVGLIGCAGLGYMANLAFLASKRIKAEERQTLWFEILPIVGYAGFLVTAAAWALASSFAPEIGGLACAVLLAAALHNCWTMTLIIVSRPG
jgi:lipid-A-disaccharide synthase-like uncharacterized protein